MDPIATYDAEMFNSLPTLARAYRNLEHVRPKLDRFGSTIAEHKLEGTVALALLHRHFLMDPAERLVERVDPAAGVSTARPEPGGGRRLIPHVLRAARRGHGYVWHPTEFVETDDAAVIARFETLARHADFLDAFARLLDDEGALDELGLSVFHGREDIRCGVEEVLVETTDDAARVLTMRSRPRRELEPDNTVDTLWLWDGVTCTMACTCQKRGSNHDHTESN